MSNSGSPASILPELTVSIETARRGPVRLALDLNEAQREALADQADIDAVKALSFQGDARVAGPRAIRVTGELKATVRYICGVSLKPFDAALVATVDHLFTDSVRLEEEGTIDMADEETLEPLHGGTADIASLLWEIFAVSLDPYPRLPDLPPPDQGKAEDEEDTHETPSPFAVLKDLKL